MEMDSNLVETAAAAAAASTASSTGNATGVSGVSDRFPVGLRVLVVDDDPICLKILERMLMNCLYEVTTCSRAIVALSMLRERKDGFDLVISDVYMPDMDGFKLLEYIGLEMDLPVIMMSAADGKDVVMKGVTHGACDYLIKPVRMEAIKNIWQHVIRKKRNEMKELEQSGSFEDSDKHKKSSEDGDYASSVNEENWRNSKRRKEEEDEGEEREDSSSLKKPRVVWSVELHQQFVAAVNQLGVEKAVPKKILELMNVPGLTRENVASHLQKFRLYLRRIKPGTQHHGGLNNDFVGSPDANFNPFVSLDGLDLHALAVSGQHPPQNLVNIDGNRRPIVTSGMGMSIIDQVNLFNPDLQIANSSKIRYGSAQHLSSKQLSLLHGFPIAMDPKHLAHVHQPLPSLGSMGLQINEGARSGFLNLPTQRQYPSANMHQVLGSDCSPSMMHMTQNRQHYPTSQNANQIQGDMFQQSKSRGELLNEIAGGSAPGFPSERQQIISYEVAGQVIGRNGPVVNGLPSSQGACFSNNSSYITVSQPSINLPKTQDTKLPRDGFPLTGRSGIFQGAVSKTRGLEGLQNENGLKGTRPPIPQFDIFNEFHPHKNQDWELQHTNLSCKTTQIINLPNNPSFGQGHQGLTGSQENRENRDGHGNTDGIDKDEHYILGDSSVRVKAVGLTNLNSDYMLLNEHFGQGDVINSHFKQKQQEEIEPVETEFCLDGFHMDDILV